MLVVEQNANVSLSIADRGYVLSTGTGRARGQGVRPARGRGPAQGVPGPLMGVVSAEGQIAAAAGLGARARDAAPRRGRDARGRRCRRTTSSCSRSPAAASSTATGSPTAARRCCSRERPPSSRRAPRASRSCAITLGADTDLHAPMGPRERIVEVNAVEPGKATGSRSFQILFGPHNGSRRATMFVGYVPPGKRAVALPPLRRDLLDLARPRPLPPRRRGRAARGRLLPSGSRRGRCTSSRTRARTASSRSSASSPPPGRPSAAYLTPDVVGVVRVRDGVSSATGRSRSRPTASETAIRGEFPIFEHTIVPQLVLARARSRTASGAAYEEYLAGWDENGAEWEFWVERAEAARAGFAELLHGEPDEVAVTTSVSQGVSGDRLGAAVRARRPHRGS